MEVTRKQVSLKQVVHYGVYGDGTGYIYLEGFKERSADEVREALEDLKQNHHIKSLILDLRDNGGGLLSSAVQIVNLFVPKGREVLSTRGKMKLWDRTYRTTLDPVDSVIPLAVLINGNSASAAEIVSGALQDMDRAVLIGNRSFGKGLVQTPRDLPYEGQIKITTSKYYIPSGRCIQQLDYSHRNADGSVSAVPDSLTSVFYTASGRPVRDGGGIRPDCEMEEKKTPTMLFYLVNDFAFFDFVTDWVRAHPTIAPAKDFVFPDADYESFKKRLKEANFTYDRQSEKALKNLREVAEYEGYLAEDSATFVALEARLKPNLDRDLERHAYPLAAAFCYPSLYRITNISNSTHRMKKLVILTGAGMSAESGISTFRDSNGLWENYRVEDVATPEGFARNPQLVLDFYNARRRELLRAEPNDGHRGLAALERDFDVRIVTQNVDNLHERAGSSHVIHLHGELMKACSERNPNRPIDIDPEHPDMRLGDTAPDGGRLRPFIVWFGEPVPMIEEAIRIVSDCDLFAVIGTSLNVYPAAGLLSYVRRGQPIFLIDPKEVAVYRNDVEFIRCGASEGVRILTDRLQAFR